MSGMHMNSGLRLGSRYSRVPNGLGYCGPNNMQDDFLRCIIDGDCKAVEYGLKKFEGLYPYLQLIGQKHGKQPFDYDVVEAYWLGNRLIEEFTRQEFAAHIDVLCNHGLPKQVAEGLKQRVPENPIPSHFFNVIFVGVGNISGSVKPILQNMDKCRVSWGKVKSMNKEELIVMRMPLEFDEKYFFGKECEASVSYDSKIFQGLKKGDFVSMHWGQACEILSEERAGKLKHYSEKVLRSI